MFHQQWGEAQGEEIIIHENDGRAEVIGGSEGRSRLILPPLGKSEKPNSSGSYLKVQHILRCPLPKYPL